MSSAARFTLRPGPPLEIRIWDDRAVVFDPRSGDTHVIDVIAAEVLTYMAAAPQSAADLCAKLTATFDLASESTDTYLDDLIGRLKDLGIILAVPSVRLKDLSAGQVRQSLASGGIRLQTGPFVVDVRTPFAKLAGVLHALYADFPIVEDDSFADFHIDVSPRRGWRRATMRDAVFTAGGGLAHHIFRRRLAFAFFEWGLNGCIWRTAHQYLILHAAVVERQGVAVVLMGQSGSGKSTLCAALTLAGWRLISDELALIPPGGRKIVPLPRPISLKNQSIEVVRTLSPAAVMGPVVLTLRKGHVGHLRPPAESVANQHDQPTIGHIVFVRYEPSATAVASIEIHPAEALARVARESFNYGLLGRQAFDDVTRLVREVPCATLTYKDIEQAIRFLENTVDSATG